ncbi:hypothetical protein V6N13_015658 [Hibiscus sabdariffa]|uniref:Uncharacterized protein n=1 Tax=Hibiscus sabdariffa TaxID=183260 RepID=A0ABR2CWC8_9ROSI
MHALSSIMPQAMCSAKVRILTCFSCFNSWGTGPYRLPLLVNEDRCIIIELNLTPIASTTSLHGSTYKSHTMFYRFKSASLHRSYPLLSEQFLSV